MRLKCGPKWVQRSWNELETDRFGCFWDVSGDLAPRFVAPRMMTSNGSRIVNLWRQSRQHLRSWM